MGNTVPLITFTRFREPVFGGAQSFAFQATVSGPGISDRNVAGLWAATPVSALREIVRKGGRAPGTDARFGEFTSLSMPGTNAVFFTATLQGPVSSRDNFGLWMWTAENGVTLRLRKGQHHQLGPALKTLSTFRVLDNVRRSQGHGRISSMDEAVFTWLKFTDGIQAATAVAITPGQAFVKTGDPFIGVVPVKFGVPDFRDLSGRPLVLAELEGARSSEDVAVLDYDSGVLIARTGGHAPGEDGGLFRAFDDPVTNKDANGAPVDVFRARLTDGSTGIWSYGGTPPAFEAVAREGSEFASFTSLTVVEGRGALFVAKDSENGAGVWAIDSTGELRRLFREGDMVSGKVLRTFDLLESVSGSPGQRRAWAEGDPTPRVIWRAYFTDGSSAILTTTIP